MKVGRAEARELRIEVREEPPLQQRIVREVDPRHEVRRAERHLLGLGEEVVGPAVEHHPADDLQRAQLFGDELGRVQVVELEALGFFLREELNRETPTPERLAGRDGLEHVAAVKVRDRRRRS